jgi:hypothetical protein|tara:strand:+ start:364 stop:762 length:399 start_codon:yes stop_codon:yes gene_type:complete
MESIRIKDLRRRLSIRKEQYRVDLNYVGRLFQINEKEYMDKYDSISSEMVDVGIELDKLTVSMNQLDMEYEKIKKGLLLKENINLLDCIDKFGDNKKHIVEQLSNGGFISDDETDILFKHIWDNRYKHKYSD